MGRGARVPFLDLRRAHAEIREELVAAVESVIDRGWFVLGPEVERFEAEWASYVGAKQCVAVNSGLDALSLSLRALGIGPGHEVVVPANTYVATWLAVSAVGARPVAVEPRESTLNVDPEAISAAVSGRTRCLLPVHLYGQPAEMDPIRLVASTAAVPVLEDAAQAHGARWRSARAGALGSAAAFSFYPSKNLGALGDAGAVTTDDASVADELRTLRNYGSRERYHNLRRGSNSRCDELQAAVLRVKLRHLEDWNRRRREHAMHYLRELAGLDWLALPEVASGAEPVWHLFVVRCSQRDRLREHLATAGIQTEVHYPIAPYRQPAYADLFDEHGSSFPISDAAHRQVLSMPIGPHLTEWERDLVVAAVRSFRP